jgi:hypothetical protein
MNSQQSLYLDLGNICGGWGLIPKLISWKLLRSCEPRWSFCDVGNENADSIKKKKDISCSAFNMEEGY